MQEATIDPALFLTTKLNHPAWLEDEGWQSGEEKVIEAYNAGPDTGLLLPSAPPKSQKSLCVLELYNRHTGPLGKNASNEYCEPSPWT